MTHLVPHTIESLHSFISKMAAIVFEHCVNCSSSTVSKYLWHVGVHINNYRLTLCVSENIHILLATDILLGHDVYYYLIRHRVIDCIRHRQSMRDDADLCQLECVIICIILQHQVFSVSCFITLNERLCE